MANLNINKLTHSQSKPAGNETLLFLSEIIKLFKYELLKIIVFLFIFAFSLIYVLHEDEKYYSKQNHYYPASEKINR